MRCALLSSESSVMRAQRRTVAAVAVGCGVYLFRSEAGRVLFCQEKPRCREHCTALGSVVSSALLLVPQAFLHLLLDVSETGVTLAILWRCLAAFRPLALGWFPLALRPLRRWLLPVVGAETPKNLSDLSTRRRRIHAQIAASWPSRASSHRAAAAAAPPSPSLAHRQRHV